MQVPPSAPSRRRALLALLWIASVHAAGLFLFTTGFFLTRFEVPNVSDCHTPPHDTDALRTPPHLRTAAMGASARTSAGTSDADQPGCWMPRRFRRVVFVVVDALRFDFVQSSTAPSSSSSRSFYLDHLPILNATLHAQPAHALLLKFVADAPTMTMQRLKGLTTGGLPTFLDIKDNMASSEITEDNLLAQLQRVGRPIVFMGDDTWDALYRHAFTRKYAFDSFNVKDLHSVDRGVVRHLFPELQRDDWDLLIAHFLGVDHVGHTHGPSSPFMTEKLDEMNGMLTKLLTELATQHDDTLLLVMGDHGMSADGNHGGASDDETGAALFAYSAQQPLVDPLHAAAWPSEVPQVDLVPTLALLAGLPIPFGSLGAVIPQLFPDRASLVKALQLNVAQVRRYLITYSAASKLPQSEFDYLERLHDAIQALSGADDELDELVARQQAYLREALALGRSIWTQFDLCGMGWGIVLLAAALALVVWHLVGDPMVWIREATLGALGGAIIGAVASSSALAFLPRTLLTRVLALAAFGSVVVPSLLCVGAHRSPLPPAAEPFRRPQRLPLPSSSSVVAFVTVLLHALALLSNSYIVAEDRVMLFLTTTVGFFLMWFAQHHVAAGAKPQAVAAAAVVVVASRVASALDPPNIIQSATSLTRTWLPLGTLVGSFVVRLWTSHRDRPRFQTTVSTVAVLWASSACAAYWHWSPIASSLARLWLPRSVFLLALAALALRAVGSSNSVHDVVGTQDPTLLLLLLAYSLVLGPTSPLTVLCLALQHAGFVRVAQLCFPKRTPPLAWVWLWCSACAQSFFTTGHQSTFTSLQNAAAFVGFDDFRFYWAGALLGANTFGNYALALLALASSFASISSSSSSSSSVVAPARALLAVVAYFALNALVSTAFVALQRRHLMVWAIFAPKFIFDGATLLVVELLALSSLAIVAPSPPKTHTPLE